MRMSNSPQRRKDAEISAEKTKTRSAGGAGFGYWREEERRKESPSLARIGRLKPAPPRRGASGEATDSRVSAGGARSERRARWEASELGSDGQAEACPTKAVRVLLSIVAGGICLVAECGAQNLPFTIEKPQGAAILRPYRSQTVPGVRLNNSPPRQSEYC